jgi:ubiquitin carboxyl-terminal hydrolase 4/11/15
MRDAEAGRREQYLALKAAHPFSEGSNGYLVARAWYSQWKCAPDSFSDPVSAEGCSTANDSSYKLICPDVWDAFVGWYGRLSDPFTVGVHHDRALHKFRPVCQTLSIFNLPFPCLTQFEADGQFSDDDPFPQSGPVSLVFLWNPAPLGPGKVGLHNIGNSCYLNSAVQSLAHCLPLVRFFQSSGWDIQLNSANPLGAHGRLARRFSEIVTDIWTGINGAVEPRALKEEMGNFAVQFQGQAQHDSHELLTFLLDGIHEDLNRRRDKPIIESLSGNGSDDLDVAERAWSNHRLRNDSVIVDLFHGQLRSTLFCPECQTTTVVFDPFSTLSAHRVSPISATFVPASFLDRPFGINITLFDGDVSAAVSKAVGRDVAVAFGNRDQTDRLTWGLGDGRGRNYYAFEITGTDRFYVPYYIEMLVQGVWFGGSSLQNVAGPFLISVADDKCDDAELRTAAEDALDSLWSSELTGLSVGEAARQAADSIEFPEDSLEKGRLRVARTAPLARDVTYPHLSVAGVLVELGREAVDHRNFCLTKLLVHYPEQPGAGRAVERGVSLGECLDFFSMREVLDSDNKWYCAKCGQFVCAAKKMDMWRVPSVLVVHLKRFLSAGNLQQKSNVPVAVPDVMDVARFVIGPEAPRGYRLFAVGNHFGGMCGGHYTAHCRVGETWYCFDDSSVSEAPDENSRKDGAYLLFYEMMAGYQSRTTSMTNAFIVLIAFDGARLWA